MKRYSAVIILLLLLSGCSSDDSPTAMIGPVNNLPKLPSISITVGGRTWRADSSCYVYGKRFTGILGDLSYIEIWAVKDEALYLHINKPSEGSFSVGNRALTHAAGYHDHPTTEWLDMKWKTDDLRQGTVTISSLDLATSRVSGSFQFSAWCSQLREEITVSGTFSNVTF